MPTSNLLFLCNHQRMPCFFVDLFLRNHLESCFIYWDLELKLQRRGVDTNCFDKHLEVCLTLARGDLTRLALPKPWLLTQGRRHWDELDASRQRLGAVHQRAALRSDPYAFIDVPHHFVPPSAAQ